MSAIISYFPIASTPEISAPLNYAPLVSHRFGNVYSATAGTDQTNSGIRKHDAWPNGSELVARNLASIGVTSTLGINLPWTLTYNSQCVAAVAAGSNSAGVTLLNQRDLSLFAQIGVASSSLSPTPALPGGNRMLTAGQMVAIQIAGQDYLITTTVTASSEVDVVNISAGLCANVGTMSQTRGVLGALPDGSGSIAYCLGIGGTTDISLYTVTPTALTKITDIAPSAIDAGWSHIDTVWGIAIDQTDGNLLCAVQDLTDAPTHTTYFVKLNAGSGAVMWKLILPGAIQFSSNDLQQALITKGKFYYLASNDTVAVIDTKAGTILENPAFSNGGVSSSHPGQVSEDVVGSVYYMGGWAQSATTPTYYGTYMGPPGNNHAITNAPIRYFPDTSAPSPPTPAIPASSRQRAWSFTLDGHKFYVLDLGSQGTLLYDTTTTSWCQFVTSGYLNWNFRNGTMWGQRIVGGDTDSPQIWEMSPSSMKDGGALDITHITTGALIKRTRTYSSLAGVRLAVSVGDLDDTGGGATVLLEFSDDQGNTWTAMDTLPLTENDFSAELAWTGLGSFAAPGRIFRITDVGGFVRIDGCDAELDDFDEDGNSATQENGG